MKSNILILLFGVLFASQAITDPMPVITGDVTTEFGTYRPRTYTVMPSVPPYEIAPDLSNVTGSVQAIPDSIKSMLAAQGFAGTGSLGSLTDITNISGVYQKLKDEELPVFITTDACLHTFHVLYDYILRVIEEQYFYYDAISLTTALIENTSGMIDTVDDPVLRDAAVRNLAYLSVAMKLLDPDFVIDPVVVYTVEAELALIDAQAGTGTSTLMSTDTYAYIEDYSQYKPRGHYTRTSLLEKYFRALMWYGRITFPLGTSIPPSTDQRLYTRQALLLTQALATIEIVTGEPAADVWDRLYQPTVFFVGKSDDLTWGSYLDVAKDIYGDDFLTQPVSVFADTTMLDAFITDAKDLPDPEINPGAGKGFRLMGQRFIPDSYILDQLVDPVSRTMPRGLDVMAVLGSERAYEIIDTVYGDPATYYWYSGKVAELNAKFAAYPAEVWAQNLYWGWLYSLLPLLDEKGTGYPLFMQSDAWRDKSLATSLGSWAELRHDTILYAKQSVTPISEGPSTPDLVRGYVEPEPAVYGRLAALAAYMREGLDRRGLLHSAFADKLADFDGLMDELARIAVDELENRPLADADYALMCNFGDTTSEIITFPPDPEQHYEDDSDTNMAVIADVHTDMNTNTCLEVGVGNPLPIYVIAPVDGVPTLTYGAMFAYYEFTRPLTQGRLSDEEWQELLDTPDTPAAPAWTTSFNHGIVASEYRYDYGSMRGAVVVHAEEADQTPLAFSIAGIYPNPFNPRTVIRYSLEQGGPVHLAVHAITGQQVAILVDDYRQVGSHEIAWSPDGLGAGCYFVVLRQFDGMLVSKAVYLK